ncbi:hypothetical protein NIES2134_124980 [Thermostichus vulcanus NIES-2134]|nr:hypothetical protein NIES2134_124980 [Thermostichus vulcanus NIES-2134]
MMALEIRHLTAAPDLAQEEMATEAMGSIKENPMPC